MRENPDLPITMKGAAYVLYHSGIKQIADPEAFQLIENQIDRFKGKFDRRLTFGGLYGCLKTNGTSMKMTDFFLDEFRRIKDNLSNYYKG